MVLNESIGNLTMLKYPLPAEMLTKISGVVLFLKALSVVAILYVIFIIIKGIIAWRELKKIDRIEKRTDEIVNKIKKLDKKLDKLILKRRLKH